MKEIERVCFCERGREEKRKKERENKRVNEIERLCFCVRENEREGEIGRE